jgi:class 3 adenylate cyclase
MEENANQQETHTAPTGANRRRTGRGLPDLDALLNDVDSSLENSSPKQELDTIGARPRTRPQAGRALDALLQTDHPSPVGDDVPLANKPEKSRAVPPLENTAVRHESDPAVLLAARRAQKPETLLSLFDEDKSAPPAPPTQAEKRLAALADLGATSSETEQESSEALQIPQELQPYLSPDLWRRLTAASPQRGVLINALERMRSVLYLISTFVPANLVQEKMRRPVAGLIAGQALSGSLLFSDVSGFTALSEKLAALGSEGAERLTALMNQYFSEMLEILSWSGGVLLKFAGDATLVYFPEQEDGQQALWAVHTGQRMQRAMARLALVDSPGGKTQLSMKIGIASGQFLAASIGTAQRMEYCVLGPAIVRTMAAEGQTTGAGQIVVDEQTARILGPDMPVLRLKNGFCRLQSHSGAKLDSFEIKPETRRARGAIPWSASPQAIIAQTSVALRQIQSLAPYLAPELVEKIIAHARQRQVTSQYRPTTVMFINFWGLEAVLELWGASGVQRVTSLLNSYFTTVHEVITRYGGVISRIDPYSKGTKILVLFGAPIAHEDDPQRAISAALAMNAELELLEEGWRKKFARHIPADLNEPLLQHRIGITTGETFAGQVGSSTRREYTVMGDEVNLAARLMGAAEPGRVLVSQMVSRAVEDYFALTSRPAIRVKGKSKPIPIFQVEGPRDDTLARRAHNRGRTIGRESELSQAQSVLQKAILGQGGILILQGPAGIGKSHLADELLNRMGDQGAQIISIQCHSYSNETPFAGWSALVRALAQVTTLDYQPEIILNKLIRLLNTLQLPASLVPPLSALIGLQRAAAADSGQAPETVESDASQEGAGALAGIVRNGRLKRKGSSLELFEQLENQHVSASGQSWHQMPAQLKPRERSELYEAVWSLLASTAASAPVIIFFEDAHWMDAASRDLLNFCAPRLRNSSMAFLLAQREVEGSPEKTAITLELQPLRPEGTSELVAYLLVSDLAQVIHEQSLGNPLFVDEITRWFKRTRNLSASELKNVLQSSNILQKLVLSSIENLPEIQREIAQAASVIGNEFRTGEVRALLSAEMDSVTLSIHLRSLTRERLIELTEAGADARYAFQQSLVRDILYGSLPFEKRREYHARLASYLSMPLSQRRKVHARIAAALDANTTNDASHETELVAYHYEQAGRWFDAARNYLAAGSFARTAKSRQKALELYGHSIAALSNLKEEEFTEEAISLKVEAFASQGILACLAGDFLLAVSSFESALAAFPATANPAERRSLSVKLALTLPLQNRGNDAIKILHETFETPDQTGDILVAASLAWLYARTNTPLAAKWIARSQQILIDQPASDMPAIRTILLELSGDLETASESYKMMNKPSGAAAIAIHLGDRELNNQDLAAALEHYRRAEALWRNEVPEWSGLALALNRQAEITWRRGDLTSARSSLEAAQQMLSSGSPLLRAEGQVAIQQALRLIAKGGKGQWPVYNWQAYQDAFHATALIE